MKEKEKQIFENLLKERKRLSKINKENKKSISSDDIQLMDMIDSFNESDDYKEMQPGD